MEYVLLCTPACERILYYLDVMSQIYFTRVCKATSECAIRYDLDYDFIDMPISRIYYRTLLECTRSRDEIVVKYFLRLSGYSNEYEVRSRDVYRMSKDFDILLFDEKRRVMRICKIRDSELVDAKVFESLPKVFTRAKGVSRFE